MLRRNHGSATLRRIHFLIFTLAKAEGVSQEGCILGNVPIFFYADRGKPEYLAKYNKPFNTGSLQGLAIQINTDQELLSETQHGLSGAPDVSLSEGWLGSAVLKTDPPSCRVLT